MKRLLISLIGITFLMLSGCVTLMSQDGKTSQERLMGKPFAILKISRPSIIGFARTTPIYVNGTYIGRLGAGKTIDYKVKPGKVFIETSKFTASFASSRHSTLSVNATAGKTYTIEVSIPAQIDLLGPVTDLVYELRLIS